MRKGDVRGGDKVVVQITGQVAKTGDSTFSIRPEGVKNSGTLILFYDETELISKTSQFRVGDVIQAKQLTELPKLSVVMSQGSGFSYQKMNENEWSGQGRRFFTDKFFAPVRIISLPDEVI